MDANKAIPRGQWLAYRFLQEQRDLDALTVGVSTALMTEKLKNIVQLMHRAEFEAVATQDDVIRLQVYGALEGKEKTIMYNGLLYTAFDPLTDSMSTITSAVRTYFQAEIAGDTEEWQGVGTNGALHLPYNLFGTPILRHLYVSSESAVPLGITDLLRTQAPSSAQVAAFREAHASALASPALAPTMVRIAYLARAGGFDVSDPTTTFALIRERTGALRLVLSADSLPRDPNTASKEELEEAEHRFQEACGAFVEDGAAYGKHFEPSLKESARLHALAGPSYLAACKDMGIPIDDLKRPLRVIADEALDAGSSLHAPEGEEGDGESLGDASDTVAVVRNEVRETVSAIASKAFFRMLKVLAQALDQGAILVDTPHDLHALLKRRHIPTRYLGILRSSLRTQRIRTLCLTLAVSLVLRDEFLSVMRAASARAIARVRDRRGLSSYTREAWRSTAIATAKESADTTLPRWRFPHSILGPDEIQILHSGRVVDHEEADSEMEKDMDDMFASGSASPIPTLEEEEEGGGGGSGGGGGGSGGGGEEVSEVKEEEEDEGDGESAEVGEGIRGWSDEPSQVPPIPNDPLPPTELCPSELPVVTDADVAEVKVAADDAFVVFANMVFGRPGGRCARWVWPRLVAREARSIVTPATSIEDLASIVRGTIGRDELWLKWMRPLLLQQFDDWHKLSDHRSIFSPTERNQAFDLRGLLRPLQVLETTFKLAGKRCTGTFAAELHRTVASWAKIEGQGSHAYPSPSHMPGMIPCKYRSQEWEKLQREICESKFPGEEKEDEKDEGGGGGEEDDSDSGTPLASKGVRDERFAPSRRAFKYTPREEAEFRSGWDDAVDVLTANASPIEPGTGMQASGRLVPSGAGATPSSKRSRLLGEFSGASAMLAAARPSPPLALYAVGPRAQEAHGAPRIAEKAIEQAEYQRQVLFGRVSSFNTLSRSRALPVSAELRYLRSVVPQFRFRRILIAITDSKSMIEKLKMDLKHLKLNGEKARHAIGAGDATDRLIAGASLVRDEELIHMLQERLEMILAVQNATVEEKRELGVKFLGLPVEVVDEEIKLVGEIRKFLDTTEAGSRPKPPETSFLLPVSVSGNTLHQMWEKEPSKSPHGLIPSMYYTPNVMHDPTDTSPAIELERARRISRILDLQVSFLKSHEAASFGPSILDLPPRSFVAVAEWARGLETGAILAPTGPDYRSRTQREALAAAVRAQRLPKVEEAKEDEEKEGGGGKAGDGASATTRYRVSLGDMVDAWDSLETTVNVEAEAWSRPIAPWHLSALGMDASFSNTTDILGLLSSITSASDSKPGIGESNGDRSISTRISCRLGSSACYPGQAELRFQVPFCGRFSDMRSTSLPESCYASDGTNGLNIGGGNDIGRVVSLARSTAEYMLSDGQQIHDAKSRISVLTALADCMIRSRDINEARSLLITAAQHAAVEQPRAGAALFLAMANIAATMGNHAISADVNDAVASNIPVTVSPRLTESVNPSRRLSDMEVLDLVSTSTDHADSRAALALLQSKRSHFRPDHPVVSTSPPSGPCTAALLKVMEDTEASKRASLTPACMKKVHEELAMGGFARIADVVAIGILRGPVALASLPVVSADIAIRQHLGLFHRDALRVATETNAKRVEASNKLLEEETSALNSIRVNIGARPHRAPFTNQSAEFRQHGTTHVQGSAYAATPYIARAADAVAMGRYSASMRAALLRSTRHIHDVRSIRRAAEVRVLIARIVMATERESGRAGGYYAAFGDRWGLDWRAYAVARSSGVGEGSRVTEEESLNRRKGALRDAVLFEAALTPTASRLLSQTGDCVSESVTSLCEHVLGESDKIEGRVEPGNPKLGLVSAFQNDSALVIASRAEGMAFSLDGDGTHPTFAACLMRQARSLTELDSPAAAWTKAAILTRAHGATVAAHGRGGIHEAIVLAELALLLAKAASDQHPCRFPDATVTGIDCTASAEEFARRATIIVATIRRLQPWKSQDDGVEGPRRGFEPKELEKDDAGLPTWHVAENFYSPAGIDGDWMADNVTVRDAEVRAVESRLAEAKSLLATDAESALSFASAAMRSVLQPVVGAIHKTHAYVIKRTAAEGPSIHSVLEANGVTPPTELHGFPRALEELKVKMEASQLEGESEENKPWLVSSLLDPVLGSALALSKGQSPSEELGVMDSLGMVRGERLGYALLAFARAIRLAYREVVEGARDSGEDAPEGKILREGEGEVKVKRLEISARAQRRRALLRTALFVASTARLCGGMNRELMGPNRAFEYQSRIGWEATALSLSICLELDAAGRSLRSIFRSDPHALSILLQNTPEAPTNGLSSRETTQSILHRAERSASSMERTSTTNPTWERIEAAASHVITTSALSNRSGKASLRAAQGALVIAETASLMSCSVLAGNVADPRNFLPKIEPGEWGITDPAEDRAMEEAVLVSEASTSRGELLARVTNSALPAPVFRQLLRRSGLFQDIHGATSPPPLGRPPVAPAPPGQEPPPPPPYSHLWGTRVDQMARGSKGWISMGAMSIAIGDIGATAQSLAYAEQDGFSKSEVLLKSLSMADLKRNPPFFGMFDPVSPRKGEVPTPIATPVTSGPLLDALMLLDTGSDGGESGGGASGGGASGGGASGGGDGGVGESGDSSTASSSLRDDVSGGISTSHLLMKDQASVDHVTSTMRQLTAIASGFTASASMTTSSTRSRRSTKYLYADTRAAVAEIGAMLCLADVASVASDTEAISMREQALSFAWDAVLGTYSAKRRAEHWMHLWDGTGVREGEDEEEEKEWEGDVERDDEVSNAQLLHSRRAFAMILNRFEFRRIHQRFSSLVFSELPIVRAPGLGASTVGMVLFAHMLGRPEVGITPVYGPHFLVHPGDMPQGSTLHPWKIRFAPGDLSKDASHLLSHRMIRERHRYNQNAVQRRNVWSGVSKFAPDWKRAAQSGRLLIGVDRDVTMGKVKAEEVEEKYFAPFEPLTTTELGFREERAGTLGGVRSVEKPLQLFTDDVEVIEDVEPIHLSISFQMELQSPMVEARLLPGGLPPNEERKRRIMLASALGRDPMEAPRTCAGLVAFSETEGVVLRSRADMKEVGSTHFKVFLCRFVTIAAAWRRVMELADRPDVPWAAVERAAEQIPRYNEIPSTNEQHASHIPSNNAFYSPPIACLEYLLHILATKNGPHLPDDVLGSRELAAVPSILGMPPAARPRIFPVGQRFLLSLTTEQIRGVQPGQVFRASNRFSVNLAERTVEAAIAVSPSLPEILAGDPLICAAGVHALLCEQAGSFPLVVSLSIEPAFGMVPGLAPDAPATNSLYVVARTKLEQGAMERTIKLALFYSSGIRENLLLLPAFLAMQAEVPMQLRQAAGMGHAPAEPLPTLPEDTKVRCDTTPTEAWVRAVEPQGRIVRGKIGVLSGLPWGATEQPRIPLDPEELRAAERALIAAADKLDFTRASSRERALAVAAGVGEEDAANDPTFLASEAGEGLLLSPPRWKDATTLVDDERGGATLKAREEFERAAMELFMIQRRSPAALWHYSLLSARAAEALWMFGECTRQPLFQCAALMIFAYASLHPRVAKRSELLAWCRSHALTPSVDVCREKATQKKKSEASFLSSKTSPSATPASSPSSPDRRRSRAGTGGGGSISGRSGSGMGGGGGGRSSPGAGLRGAEGPRRPSDSPMPRRFTNTTGGSPTTPSDGMSAGGGGGGSGASVVSRGSGEGVDGERRVGGDEQSSFHESVPQGDALLRVVGTGVAMSDVEAARRHAVNKAAVACLGVPFEEWFVRCCAEAVGRWPSPRPGLSRWARRIIQRARRDTIEGRRPVHGSLVPPMMTATIGILAFSLDSEINLAVRVRLAELGAIQLLLAGGEIDFAGANTIQTGREYLSEVLGDTTVGRAVAGLGVEKAEEEPTLLREEYWRIPRFHPNLGDTASMGSEGLSTLCSMAAFHLMSGREGIEAVMAELYAAEEHERREGIIDDDRRDEKGEEKKRGGSGEGDDGGGEEDGELHSAGMMARVAMNRLLRILSMLFARQRSMSSTEISFIAGKVEHLALVVTQIAGSDVPEVSNAVLAEKELWIEAARVLATPLGTASAIAGPIIALTLNPCTGARARGILGRFDLARAATPLPSPTAEEFTEAVEPVLDAVLEGNVPGVEADGRIPLGEKVESFFLPPPRVPMVMMEAAITDTLDQVPPLTTLADGLLARASDTLDPQARPFGFSMAACTGISNHALDAAQTLVGTGGVSSLYARHPSQSDAQIGLMIVLARTSSSICQPWKSALHRCVHGASSGMSALASLPDYVDDIHASLLFRGSTRCLATSFAMQCCDPHLLSPSLSSPLARGLPRIVDVADRALNLIEFHSDDAEHVDRISRPGGSGTACVLQRAFEQAGAAKAKMTAKGNGSAGGWKWKEANALANALDLSDSTGESRKVLKTPHSEAPFPRVDGREPPALVVPAVEDRAHDVDPLESRSRRLDGLIASAFSSVFVAAALAETDANVSKSARDMRLVWRLLSVLDPSAPSLLALVKFHPEIVGEGLGLSDVAGLAPGGTSIGPTGGLDRRASAVGLPTERVGARVASLAWNIARKAAKYNLEGVGGEAHALATDAYRQAVGEDTTWAADEPGAWHASAFGKVGRSAMEEESARLPPSIRRLVSNEQGLTLLGKGAAPLRREACMAHEAAIEALAEKYSTAYARLEHAATLEGKHLAGVPASRAWPQRPSRSVGPGATVLPHGSPVPLLVDVADRADYITALISRTSAVLRCSVALGQESQAAPDHCAGILLMLCRTAATAAARREVLDAFLARGLLVPLIQAGQNSMSDAVYIFGAITALLPRALTFKALPAGPAPPISLSSRSSPSPSQSPSPTTVGGVAFASFTSSTMSSPTAVGDGKKKKLLAVDDASGDAKFSRLELLTCARFCLTARACRALESPSLELSLMAASLLACLYPPQRNDVSNRSHNCEGERSIYPRATPLPFLVPSHEDHWDTVPEEVDEEISAHDLISSIMEEWEHGGDEDGEETGKLEMEAQEKEYVGKVWERIAAAKRPAMALQRMEELELEFPGLHISDSIVATEALGALVGVPDSLERLLICLGQHLCSTKESVKDELAMLTSVRVILAGHAAAFLPVRILSPIHAASSLSLIASIANAGSPLIRAAFRQALGEADTTSTSLEVTQADRDACFDQEREAGIPGTGSREADFDDEDDEEDDEEEDEEDGDGEESGEDGWGAVATAMRPPRSPEKE